MTDIPVEKLVSTFLRIRDAKAKIDEEYKTKIEPLEEQMSLIKQGLLEHCKTQNAESVRTAAGTFYRTIKTRYWTDNWATFGEFVVAQGLPELYEKRMNQTNMKTYLEEHPDASIPGLNVDSEYTITVRKA